MIKIARVAVIVKAEADAALVAEEVAVLWKAVRVHVKIKNKVQMLIKKKTFSFNLVKMVTKIAIINKLIHNQRFKLL